MAVRGRFVCSRTHLQSLADLASGLHTEACSGCMNCRYEQSTPSLSYMAHSSDDARLGLHHSLELITQPTTVGSQAPAACAC